MITSSLFPQLKYKANSFLRYEHGANISQLTHRANVQENGHNQDYSFQYFLFIEKQFIIKCMTISDFFLRS